MIDELKEMEAHVCVSKLFGTTFKGFDSTVESDITRLKRGIRYSNQLNWHEAFYLAVKNVGMIDVLHTICKVSGKLALGKIAYHVEIDRHQYSLKSYQDRLKNPTNTPDHAATYADYIEYYEKCIEGLQILQSVQKDAEAIYEQFKLGKTKNLKWEQLTSVKFFQYDGHTNRFVEFDHTKKV